MDKQNVVYTGCNVQDVIKWIKFLVAQRQPAVSHHTNAGLQHNSPAASSQQTILQHSFLFIHLGNNSMISNHNRNSNS